MPNFKDWLISHYTQRLAEERAAGNIKAVAFLRHSLFTLKNSNYVATS